MLKDYESKTKGQIRVQDYESKTKEQIRVHDFDSKTKEQLLYRIEILTQKTKTIVLPTTKSVDLKVWHQIEKKLKNWKWKWKLCQKNFHCCQ